MSGRDSRRSKARLACLAALSVLALAFALLGPWARAQPLVADLSSHLVPITTGFTGKEVLLFGAVEGEGDIAVVVRGPEARTIVRRKDKIAGVWANRDSMTFAAVPTFYATATSRPIAELAPEPILQRHQIGIERLRLAPETEAAPARLESFRAALIRNKQRDGLYKAEPGKIAFLTGRLFRTDVVFPANVPTGAYTVEVFLIRDGAVVSAQTTPLVISKVGLGSEVFQFAHRYEVAYGLIAVAFALMAGWAASAAFRRI